MVSKDAVGQDPSSATARVMVKDATVRGSMRGFEAPPTAPFQDTSRTHLTRAGHKIGVINGQSRSRMVKTKDLVEGHFWPFPTRLQSCSTRVRFPPPPLWDDHENTPSVFMKSL